LVNLLSNAVKFSRTRAPARIEIECTEENPHRVVLSIRDNGVGFDMKYESKLFGVFQRLHTQDEFEGTGIGLATVRRIAHRHGGAVWAEAEPDAGAKFYLALCMPAGSAQ
jgi:light-regulated signal transduction histidine kinase (bacteriophytochrome)